MNRRTCSWILALAFVAALAHAMPAAGQGLFVHDPRAQYLRVVQLSDSTIDGSLTVWPVALDDALKALGASGHPWSGYFEPASGPNGPRPRVTSAGLGMRVFTNTSFPVGQGDGAVWQGKGITTALDGGASLAWRALTVTLRPSLIFTQNASFELAPVEVANVPVYAYPWRRMDFPQRFGPDAFWTLDPGETEVAVRAFGAAVGFGTTSLWWGPARHNAIVMSDNAPGFPHLFVGTDGALDVGIGELEVQWIWGDLDQSDWFDPAVADRDRFLTGFVAAYSPSFLDGLTLGVTRVFYAWKPDGGIPLSDYFLVFQGFRKKAFRTPENPEGDDEHDQLFSLFGRWYIRPGGFEVYAEWARNDHSLDFRDFILQPAHSRGYTLGLQRALDLSGDRILALGVELTDLQKGSHRRASPTYYSHHIVVQGYTQRGQIIGAGVGPGGNSQRIDADLYAPWGRVGVFVQREVRDNDAFLVWTVDKATKYWEHDILLHLGAHAYRMTGDVQVGGGVQLTRELNRFFAGRDLWNLGVRLDASWRPR